MRISKIIKPLRFVVLVFVLNIVLCFLVEPANGASDNMWSKYYEETELDTVFVGSSVCEAAFDTSVFDEKLGVRSFNMGTPMQAIVQTVDALEIAFKDHSIETVVFGMGFFCLQEEAVDEAELTFHNAYARQAGGIKGIAKSIEYIFSEDVRGSEKSINYFFPWTYNQIVMSWGGIGRNVTAKLNTEYEEFDADAEEWKKWYLEKGYNPFTGVVNYDNAWQDNSSYYYSPTFNQECVNAFIGLIELCKENGADLIVVNVPHPTYDVVSCYKSYGENERELVQLCDEYGVDYYNFSLAKEEIFASKPEYYYDFEHLNYKGSQVFCQDFADFMIRRENGENMKEYFYTIEEYLMIHADLLEEWKTEYEPR